MIDGTLIYPLVPSTMSLILIYFYVKACNTNNQKEIRFIQPVTIVPIIFACALSILTPGFNKEFTLFTMAGLLFALVGDVNNVDIRENMNTLMNGLIIAVIAYCCYWVGMWRLNGYQSEDLVMGLIIFHICLTLIIYLWKGLTSSFKIPVIIYTFNMGFLVWRASSTFFGGNFSFIQALLLTFGSSMLFLGDVELAIHTFKGRNSLKYGAFLYAFGQLLLGLAPSYFVY